MKTTSSVVEHGTAQYGAYKDAYADYVFNLFAAMVEVEKAGDKSRARVHDIATGHAGDQITIPLDDIKLHDARAEQYDADATAAYQYAETIAQAGAADYGEHADEYYQAALDEDKERSKPVN